jgi:hypothetical protein
VPSLNRNKKNYQSKEIKNVRSSAQKLTLKIGNNRDEKI